MTFMLAKQLWQPVSAIAERRTGVSRDMGVISQCCVVFGVGSRCKRDECLWRGWLWDPTIS